MQVEIGREGKERNRKKQREEETDKGIKRKKETPEEARGWDERRKRSKSKTVTKLDFHYQTKSQHRAMESGLIQIFISYQI